MAVSSEPLVKLIYVEKKLRYSFWLKILEAKHDSGKLCCPVTALIVISHQGPVVQS